VFYFVNIFAKNKSILVCVYRKIYALNGFFFLINLIDWSVPWHPESKIIIDIPTAVTFFLEKKEHTKRKVTEMSQKLVDAWNEMYGGTKNVSYQVLKNE
jgi:hypothetical protein